jgi:diacylglycerol kinase family enzyme
MRSGSETGKRRVFVVVNPVAGKASVEAIRSAFDRQIVSQGWDCELYETTGNESVAEITRKACENGFDLVVAAGGDGTVAGVVNGLINSGIPLGILPVGTGNGLARALGIPLDLESALGVLAGDNTLTWIDAMQVGEEYYTLNVSAGISASAMRRTDPEKKRRFGMLAYVWTIAGEALRFRSRRFNLVVDAIQMQVSANEVLVSNGALLLEPPFPLGPPESFGDGQFDVYLISARSLLDYLKILWNLISNPVKREEELRHLTVKESIRIDSVRQPQSVQADGEALGHTPVEVRVASRAVQVIVP